MKHLKRFNERTLWEDFEHGIMDIFEEAIDNGAVLEKDDGMGHNPEDQSAPYGVTFKLDFYNMGTRSNIYSSKEECVIAIEQMFGRLHNLIGDNFAFGVNTWGTKGPYGIIMPKMFFKYQDFLDFDHSELNNIPTMIIVRMFEDHSL